ncbi:MAG: hypothetical protein ACOX5Z_06385 [Desulfobulbus sp.]|jgi:hypothetical protein
MRIAQCIASAAIAALLAGCGIKEGVRDLVGLDDTTAYSGPVYPATHTTEVAFQPAQVDSACRVFAQALAFLPSGLSGQEVATTLLAEAGQRGADGILVGRARVGEGKSTRFMYFGPVYPYLCTEQCGSWKFGYEIWEKQGPWIPLGYGEWGNAQSRFDTPLTIQLLLLRCQ